MALIYEQSDSPVSRILFSEFFEPRDHRDRRFWASVWHYFLSCGGIPSERMVDPSGCCSFFRSNSIGSQVSGSFHDNAVRVR